jgi:hypothetical protein
LGMGTIRGARLLLIAAPSAGYEMWWFARGACTSPHASVHHIFDIADQI